MQKPDRHRTPLAQINARSASGRGDASRHALLAAGAKIFSEKGLEGASTREIAAQAKQNIAAIAYYFGGKDGLYRAVAQGIGADMATRMQPLISEIEANTKLTQADAKRYLQRMVSIMLRAILASDSPISQFILREQQHPTDAFDALYSSGMGRVHKAMTRLFSYSLRCAPDDPDAVLRAHALIGQIIGFQVARALVLRRTGWTHFGTAEIELIERAILANLDAVWAAECAQITRRK